MDGGGFASHSRYVPITWKLLLMIVIQIVIDVPGGEKEGLLASYMTNSDWDMREFSIKPHHLHYGGFDNYTTVSVSMTIKRQGSYYNRLFVAPAAVALFVIPVIHFMPPTSNEKLTLGMILLVASLSMFVFRSFLGRKFEQMLKKTTKKVIQILRVYSSRFLTRFKQILNCCQLKMTATTTLNP